MANKYWVVIKDAEVVAVHSDTENLFLNSIYDNTYNWYLADFPPEINIETIYTDVASGYIESDDLDGEIPVSTEIEVEKTETNEAIADPRITMTLTDAKAAVNSMIAARFEHEILVTYPLQVQQTIVQQGVKPGGGNYNNTDLTNMNTFINGKLTARNTLTAAVNALSTNAAVIAYDVRQ